MIRSMTAYASQTGTLDAASCAWELRGVNARGLDLRLRISDGLDGVEAAVRTALTTVLKRGTVTLNLCLTRESGGQAMSLDLTTLDAVLCALDTVQVRAFEMGVTLAQPNATDVLAQRGVIVYGATDENIDALVKAVLQDIPALYHRFLCHA